VLQCLPENWIDEKTLEVRETDPLAIDRDAVPLVESEPERLKSRPQHENDVKKQDGQDEEVCDDVPLQHMTMQVETASTGRPHALDGLRNRLHGHDALPNRYRPSVISNQLLERRLVEIAVANEQ
jgi:hypothetical protein